MAAYRCDSVSEMMQFYYQCQLHASMSHVTACRAPMEVRTPFPYRAVRFSCWPRWICDRARSWRESGNLFHTNAGNATEFRRFGRYLRQFAP
ncbi:hypothetical protein quinque_014210 [Culex quinquefasciatus]